VTFDYGAHKIYTINQSIYNIVVNGFPNSRKWYLNGANSDSKNQQQNNGKAR